MLQKLATLGAVATFVVGCGQDKPMPTAGFEIRTPLYAVGGQSGVNMGTHMTGDEEVCPACVTSTPADSKAQGEAVFRVGADGSTVDFRLIASNIDNVFMSHIHCGRPGANGPIRIWLYPGTPGPTGTPGPAGSGPQNGVLASGTFSSAGVICPATAVGTNMPLLDAMRAGLTYVNVHTDDGANGPNTGPGDFPGGEIRGQIDHGR